VKKKKKLAFVSQASGVCVCLYFYRGETGRKPGGTGVTSNHDKEAHRGADSVF